MVSVNSNDVGVIGQPQSERQKAEGRRQNEKMTGCQWTPAVANPYCALPESVFPFAFRRLSFCLCLQWPPQQPRLNAQSIEQSPGPTYIGIDLRLESVHVRKPPFVPEPLNERQS